MKRKINILAIVMVLMLIVSACSTKAKPEATVSEFIDAMKEFDVETMSKKMDPKLVDDEDLLDLELDSDDPMEQVMIDFMKENAKKTTYEIKESKEDGDSATVTVDFKYVDSQPFFKEIFTEFMKEAFTMVLDTAMSGEDLDDGELSDEEYTKIFMDIMEKKSDSDDVEFIEKTIDIKCVKIDDEWYISEDIGEDEDLLNVFTSNLLSAMENMDEFLEDELEGLDELFEEELENLD